MAATAVFADAQTTGHGMARDGEASASSFRRFRRPTRLLEADTPREFRDKKFDEAAEKGETKAEGGNRTWVHFLFGGHEQYLFSTITRHAILGRPETPPKNAEVLKPTGARSFTEVVSVLRKGRSVSNGFNGERTRPRPGDDRVPREPGITDEHQAVSW